MSKKPFALIGTVLVGILLGIGLARHQITAGAPVTPGPSVTAGALTFGQEALYQQFTRDEMISESDVIFLGKVTQVSHTTWNQGSGLAWEDKATGMGLQLHQVEFQVSKTLYDRVGIGNIVTITILGQSPLDGNADDNLKQGDQTVVFAVQRELAWRGGSKTVLRLTNMPIISYFVRGADGRYNTEPGASPVSFEDVVAQVANRHPVVAQP